MESEDILSLLFWRNLDFIIDKIFHQVGALTLMSLSQCSKVHQNIVQQNRVAQRKLAKWTKLMNNPLPMKVFSQSSMITCLAQHQETLMYPDHTQHSTTIVTWSMDSQSQGNIIVEENYPVMVSRLDFNDNLVVVVSGNTASFRGRESVSCFSRKTKVLLSKFYPHEDAISKVMFRDDVLITASFDQTIVLTDLSNPHCPKTLQTLLEHQQPVVDLSIDQGFLASLSTDATLVLWNLWLPSLKVAKKKTFLKKSLSKVCLSWPLVALYGYNLIQLWNLKNDEILRKLELAPNDRLTGIQINFGYILASDVNGIVTVWSLDDVLDGHQDLADRTHRRLQTSQNSPTIISAARFLDPSIIVASGWDGRIFTWKIT